MRTIFLLTYLSALLGVTPSLEVLPTPTPEPIAYQQLEVYSNVFHPVAVESSSYRQSSVYLNPVAVEPLTQATHTAVPVPTPINTTEQELNQRFTGLLSHVHWLLMQQQLASRQTTGDGSLADEVDLLRRQIFSYMDDVPDDLSNLSDNLSDDIADSALSLTESGTFNNSTHTGITYINGMLGIGTSSPSDVLAVNGAVYLSSVTPTNSISRLYNTGGSLYWNGSLVAGAAVGNWTDNGGDVYRATGNVGIGTTSPYAKLSVAGQVVADYFNATSLMSTSTFTAGVNVGSGNGYFIGGLRAVSGGPGTAISFGFSNTVSATGNAFGNSNSATGIAGSAFGISNTASSFVSTAFGYSNRATNFGSVAIGNSNISGGVSAIAIGGGIINNIADSLMIGPSDAAKLTILSSGNVGIGTVSPTSRLDITGLSNNTPAITLRDSLGNVSLEMRAGTSSLVNIFVGVGAGQSNTTGVFNTAYGYESLGANTTGSSNTANGFYSLRLNTTGSSNTANGDHSLFSNTTGSNNTANGLYSLRLNTTGSSNTANGYYSLYFNTTGASSTAMGYQAGRSNTTGNSNSFFGFNAGYTDGTTATLANLTNATAIGYNAQVRQSNSLILGGTGAYAVNVGIGTTSPYAKLSVVGDVLADSFNATSITATSTFTAGVNVGTGNGYYINGTAVVGDLGSTVGYRNSNTSGGMAFGVSNTSGGFYESTTIGMRNTSTGVSSAAIGRDNTVTSNFSMAIGANISNTTANSLMIGPSDESKLTILSSGNVGIGTTSPYAKLSVAGDVVADSFNATSKTGTSTFAGAIKLTARTTAAGAGAIFSGNNRLLHNYNGGNGIYDNFFAGYNAGNFTNSSFWGANTGVGPQALQSLTSGEFNTALGSRALVSNTTGSYNTVLGAQAGIGFSTTSSNTAIGYAALISSKGSRNTGLGDSAGSNSIYGNSNTFVGSMADTSGNYSNATAIGVKAIVGGSNMLVLGGTGAFGVNVGIGTTSPYAKLSVVGNAVADAFNAVSTTSTSTFANNISIASGASYRINGVPVLSYNSSSGSTNVGSNTNTSSGVTVGNGNTSSDIFTSAVGYWNIASGNFSNAFGFSNQATASNDIAFGAGNNAGGGYSIAFGSGNSAYAASSIAIGQSITNTTANSLMIGPSDAAKLTILSSGNVGIGTTSPYAKLSVVGNVVADSFSALSTTSTSTFAGNISIDGEYRWQGKTVFTTDGNGGAIGLNNSYLSSGFAVGTGNAADDALASAIGTSNIASALLTSAIGYNNTASGINSVALGFTNSATSTSATAMGSGNDAGGFQSVAMGYSNGAYAANSIAIGAGVTNSIANSLMIGPSDTAKLTILSSGNVGIGTTSPYAKLSVVGEVVADSFNATSTAFSKFAGGLTVGSNFKIFSSGIIRASQGSGFSPAYSFIADPLSGFMQTATGLLQLAANGTIYFESDNNIDAIKFSTTGGEKIRIVSSGNVGIGTTSPYAKLSVVGQTLSDSFNANSSVGYQQGGTTLLTSSPTSRNTFVGFGTGTSTNIFGNINTFVGYQAGQADVSGYGNSAVGAFALFSNNSGNFNTANGAYALYSTDAGTNNAFGYEALYANTSGIGNVAMGRGALFGNDTGSFNIGIGTNALYWNTTGTSSVAIGHKAGYSDSSGYNNTFLGYQAGYTDGTVTTGATLFNATAIGYMAQVTANNSLILGGTGANAVNVGIGTTSPYAKLSVATGDIGVFNGAICADNGGTVKCFGALTAGNVYGDGSSFVASDVAENYPVADTSLEAGDIIVLASQLNDKEKAKRERDRTKLQTLYKDETPNSIQESLDISIAKATSGGSEAVLGIVSTRPGVLLGDVTGLNLETIFKPVTLSGRVPLKVNLENGVIRKGDRITLSSVPGVGAKATATSSVTVATALEDFTSASASGRVLAFVDLQYNEAGLQLEHLVSLTATSSNSVDTTSFVSRFFESMRVWLADTTNGITQIAANIFRGKEFHAEDKLCIGQAGNETCVTKAQLDQILAGTGTSGSQGSGESNNTNSGSTDSSNTDTDVSTASSSTTTTTATSTSSTATTTNSIADIIPPVVTLLGDVTMTVDQGATYTDAGATASDDVDGDVTAGIVITGTINTATAGVYIITYNVTDTAGNGATEVTRTVEVVAPKIPDTLDNASTTTSS